MQDQFQAIAALANWLFRAIGLPAMITMAVAALIQSAWAILTDLPVPYVGALWLFDFAASLFVFIGIQKVFENFGLTKFKTLAGVIFAIVPTMVIAIALECCLGIKIGKEFKETFELNRELGKPRGEMRRSARTDQYKHEGAMIVWEKDLRTTYVFRDFPNEVRSYRETSDLEGQIDPAKVRQQLEIPPGKKPPRWGVAKFALTDRTLFPIIGGYEWSCEYNKGQTKYQVFENGLIIGPIKTSRSGSTGVNYVVLFKEKDWRLGPGNLTAQATLCHAD